MVSTNYRVNEGYALAHGRTGIGWIIPQALITAHSETLTATAVGPRAGVVFIPPAFFHLTVPT